MVTHNFVFPKLH